jgi:hypothetical protein
MLSRALALFVLLLPAAAHAAPASCPVPREKLREITEAGIEEICFAPVKALTPVRNPGGRIAAVRVCRGNLLQARESANVVYATGERQKTFRPDLQGSFDQKSAPDRAAELLLEAHAFTNVSLAALYRSRLKVRRVLGGSRRELRSLQQEASDTQANREQTVQAEKNVRAQGNTAGADDLLQKAIPAYAGDMKAIAASVASVTASRDCVEQVQTQLESAFGDWAKVKEGLLAQKFESLVTKDRYPDPALQGRAAFVAGNLQASQQRVYDTLTDPGKRSTAFRVAEACEEHSCDSWTLATTAAGWVTRTPVISIVAKSVVGTLAFTRANAEGLDVWQSLRETGNAVTPFQIHFLDTEVGAIEKGEVRPYHSSA